MLAMVVVLSLREGRGWYDYLPVAYSLLWVAWLLAIRAAVVDQL